MKSSVHVHRIFSPSLKLSCAFSVEFSSQLWPSVLSSSVTLFYTFPFVVEQRKQPQLRGLPTAVVQYNEWKGGALIAVSYEARKFGVKR